MNIITYACAVSVLKTDTRAHIHTCLWMCHVRGEDRHMLDIRYTHFHMNVPCLCWRQTHVRHQIHTFLNHYLWPCFLLLQCNVSFWNFSWWNIHTRRRKERIWMAWRKRETREFTSDSENVQQSKDYGELILFCPYSS